MGCTHKNASTETNQGRLAPTASAWRQVAVVGISRCSPEIAVCLEMHNGLGLRCPSKEDATFIPENLIQLQASVFLAHPVHNTRIGHGILAKHAVVLLCRDRQAKEGSLWLWEGVEFLCTLDGFVPEESSQAVGLDSIVSNARPIPEERTAQNVQQPGPMLHGVEKRV